MLLQFACERPVLEILHQTFRDEVHQFWGMDVRILEGRGWISGDLEEPSHGMEFRERRVALGQLDRRYSDRPYVASGVVRGIQLLLASYHLFAQFYSIIISSNIDISNILSTC